MFWETPRARTSIESTNSIAVLPPVATAPPLVQPVRHLTDSSRRRRRRYEMRSAVRCLLSSPAVQRCVPACQSSESQTVTGVDRGGFIVRSSCPGVVGWVALRPLPPPKRSSPAPLCPMSSVQSLSRVCPESVCAKPTPPTTASPRTCSWDCTLARLSFLALHVLRLPPSLLPLVPPCHPRTWH